jgi:hypothetical protein
MRSAASFGGDDRLVYCALCGRPLRRPPLVAERNRTKAVFCDQACLDAELDYRAIADTREKDGPHASSRRD